MRNFNGHREDSNVVCRYVRGGGNLSLHAAGRAVDFYASASDMLRVHLLLNALFRIVHRIAGVQSHDRNRLLERHSGKLIRGDYSC